MSGPPPSVNWLQFLLLTHECQPAHRGEVSLGEAVGRCLNKTDEDRLRPTGWAQR